MNTLDALRLSAIESSLITAQRHAAEFELMLEGFIQLHKISPVMAPIARLNSLASSYEAVAKSIRQIATELKENDHENERRIPEQVPQG